MPDNYRFHATKHSALRAKERGLSWEDMKNVVKYSKQVQQLRPGQNGGVLKKFQKTADGRTLVVIAEIKGKDCWIATGYYAD